MLQVFTTSDIGNVVRERRRQIGYTQAELAEIAGVGITFIVHLERGKQTAEIGKALTVLSYLGINLYVEGAPYYG